MTGDGKKTGPHGMTDEQRALIESMQAAARRVQRYEADKAGMVRLSPTIDTGPHPFWRNHFQSGGKP